MSSTTVIRAADSAMPTLWVGSLSSDAPDFIGHIVHEVGNGFAAWAQTRWGDGVITSRVDDAALGSLDAQRASIRTLIDIRRENLA